MNSSRNCNVKLYNKTQDSHTLQVEKSQRIPVGIRYSWQRSRGTVNRKSPRTLSEMGQLKSASGSLDKQLVSKDAESCAGFPKQERLTIGSKPLFLRSTGAKNQEEDEEWARKERNEISRLIVSLSSLYELRFELELNYEAARSSNEYNSHDLMGDYYLLKRRITAMMTGEDCDYGEVLKEYSKVCRDIIRRLHSKEDSEAFLIELLWRAIVKFCDLLLVSSRNKRKEQEDSGKQSVEDCLQQQRKEINFLKQKHSNQVINLEKELNVLKGQVQSLSEQNTHLQRENSALASGLRIEGLLSAAPEKVKTAAETQTAHSLESTHPYTVLSSATQASKDPHQVLEFCSGILKKSVHKHPFWYSTLLKLVKVHSEKQVIQSEVYFIESLFQKNSVRSPQFSLFQKLLGFSGTPPSLPLIQLVADLNSAFSAISVDSDLAPSYKVLALLKQGFPHCVPFGSAILESLWLVWPEHPAEFSSYVAKEVLPKSAPKNKQTLLLIKVALGVHPQLSSFSSSVTQLSAADSLTPASVISLLHSFLELSPAEETLLTHHLRAHNLTAELLFCSLDLLYYLQLSKSTYIERYSLLLAAYEQYITLELTLSSALEVNSVRQPPELFLDALLSLPTLELSRKYNLLSLPTLCSTKRKRRLHTSRFKRN